jgi:hypothetical protein
MLDSPERLERDVGLLERAAHLFHQMRDSGLLQAPAPSRAQLMDVIKAA